MQACDASWREVAERSLPNAPIDTGCQAMRAELSSFIRMEAALKPLRFLLKSRGWSYLCDKYRRQREAEMAFSTRTIGPVTAGALLLGACAGVPETAVPITEEEVFRAEVVGRDLIWPNGHRFVLREDGTFTGDVDGEVPVGTWAWVEGRFCREVRIGSQDFPYECQEMFQDGSRLAYVRADGSVVTGVEIR